MPGVFTHGEFDTWSPGYLMFIAAMHNGISRLYETFGNGGADTEKRILDPADYYYRRLITDAVRAVEALRDLDGVDPTRVLAAGNSQGGGLALAVAGLVPDLAGVLASAPLMCDLPSAVEITDAPPYGEIVTFLSVHRQAEAAVRRTLSYVDGVSFSRRAHAPAHFGVGLRDTVCPPSTVYGAFHEYGGEKEIEVWPYNGHEGGGILDEERALTFLRGRLSPST
jgi:cephalosporin-C deacetylase